MRTLNNTTIGFVLVVGLTLTGCAKKTERNVTDSASTVEAEQDDVLALEAGVDAEPDELTETPNAVANFEAGIAAYQANDLPLAHK